MYHYPGYVVGYYLGNVDILHLQVVQDVCEGLQRNKLSSTDILLSLMTGILETSVDERYKRLLTSLFKFTI